jgi:hypothetical protein
MMKSSDLIIRCFWIGLAVSLMYINIYGYVRPVPPEFDFKNNMGKVNTYYKIKNKNSNQLMDVTSCYIMDGVSIIQWGDNGGENQLWQLIDAGSGYFKIKSKLGGKLLSVYCGSMEAGAEIVQWADIGGDFQLWQKVDAGSGYYKLQNKKSGKLLDVKEASKKEGDPIIQWFDNGNDNQLWRFE